MKRVILVVMMASVGLASGCNREPAVDEVPVGSDVQLTRRDGALVEGKLASRDATAVKVAVGPATKSVPREEIAALRVRDAKTPAEPPPEAKFREVTIPEDASIQVRLDTAVNTATTTVETALRGELAEPVLVNGASALPAGAVVSGNVREAQPAGKVKGRASLELVFDKITSGGKTYPINARFARTAPSTKTDDAKKIGIPAAGGAIIGAIVGGKKGAAIGAAAGGGAGTAVVLTTPGREIALESGTILAMETGRSVVVQLPLR